MRTGLSANMLKNGYDRFGNTMYLKLKQHGFSCMDFCMADTEVEYYSYNEKDFDRYFNEQKNLATEAGIEFSQVHGPWRWPPRDFEKKDRQERFEKMEKSMRAAAVLGCKYWVVHPLMPFGTDDIGFANEMETRKINKDFMNKLLKTAKKYGVVICLENMPMPKFSLGSPKQILDFVNEFNDESLKICLDTGHVSVYEGLSAAEAIRELSSMIKVLHIHDNHGEYDEHLAPYKGIINWEDFSHALREIEFDGVISLETLPDTSLDDKEFENCCIELAKIAKKLADTASCQCHDQASL